MNWKLTRLAGFDNLILLLLRLGTGAFLVHETWDNLTGAPRMKEFAEFLGQFGFPLPHLMAPLSVAVQFGCGILLILGLATRAAGLLIAANFAIAIAMVHWNEPPRGWWPALVLVLLGLHFGTVGSGRIGLDRWIGKGKG